MFPHVPELPPDKLLVQELEPEENDLSDDAKAESKRQMLGALLQKGWTIGKEKGTDQLIIAKEKLQHAIGLGAKPNVIPPGEPRIDGEQRTVEIGWHPVPGMLAFSKSGLGKMITKEIGRHPDPTQHWAVLVGDYVHELWMDEKLDVIYINERRDVSEWHTFDVGTTRFTDEALKQAGKHGAVPLGCAGLSLNSAEMVIHNMRQKRPAYNVISNNCQNFAVLLLDAIQIGSHQAFATTFDVYQRATGKGSIKDLFEDKHPEEQNPPDGDALHMHRVDTLNNAQQVMSDNTTTLDNHHSLFSH